MSAGKAITYCSSLGVTDEAMRGRWFSWYVAAFFGAATGGLPFGWLGDKIGRSKALGLSVLVMSAFAAHVISCRPRCNY